MDMCLGAVIRDRRKAMKLTQEDLAEFSGLSVNFISRIERTGDQNISIKKIDAIAQSLNMDTPSLIAAAYGKVDISIINLRVMIYLSKRLSMNYENYLLLEPKKFARQFFRWLEKLMNQQDLIKKGVSITPFFVALIFLSFIANNMSSTNTLNTYLASFLI